MPYMPKVIASGYTTNTNNFSFNVDNISHCWVVVISKAANDGTSGGMYFIRQGGTQVGEITHTGTAVTYTVSAAAASSGYTISMYAAAGDMRYAGYKVYEVY